MKKLTVEEVAQALIDNISMEQTGNKARYFLHVNDNGEILPGQAGADETFWSDTDIEGLDGDWREDFETLENKKFREVCESLKNQANKYFVTWCGVPENKEIYSVELVATNFEDDTFNSDDMESCIAWCKEHEYELGKEARIALIEIDETGYVVEHIDIFYDTES